MFAILCGRKTKQKKKVVSLNRKCLKVLIEWKKNGEYEILKREHKKEKNKTTHNPRQKTKTKNKTENERK